MAQPEILELLKNEPHRWFSSKEIGEKTETKSPGKSLASLRVFRMVEIRTDGGQGYLYKHKK